MCNCCYPTLEAATLNCKLSLGWSSMSWVHFQNLWSSSLLWRHILFENVNWLYIIHSFVISLFSHLLTILTIIYVPDRMLNLKGTKLGRTKHSFFPPGSIWGERQILWWTQAEVIKMLQEQRGSPSEPKADAGHSRAFPSGLLCTWNETQCRKREELCVRGTGHSGRCRWITSKYMRVGPGNCIFKRLLWAHFTFVNSTTKPPFSRYENQGPERFCTWPKIMQQAQSCQNFAKAQALCTGSYHLFMLLHIL